jgi:hypothetical protein
MTHGTALALVTLVLLYHLLRRGRRLAAFACGFALGLTFLTKAEHFLAVAIAVTVGVAAHHWRSGAPRRDLGRRLAALASGALVPPTLAYATLASHLGPGRAARSVIGSWAYLFTEGLSDSRLYQDILGVTDVAESLVIIGAWTLRYAFFLVPALLIAIYLPRSGRAWSVARILLLPLAAASVLVHLRTANWDTLAQPFPLVVVAAGAAALVSLSDPSQSPQERARRAWMLSFVVFAFVLLAKILLYVRIAHYGFALAMPAGIVVTVVLVDGVPRILDRRGRNGDAFRLAALGILAGVVGVHLYASDSWFRLHTVQVGEGKDAFLTDSRGRVVDGVLSRLEQLTSPGETLAVLPEGVMINYLARIPNPTPYINFMPPEFAMFGEAAMVSAFEAAPPDWIVLTDRHAPEYGYDLLGTDYGLDLTGWIRRDYSLAAEVIDEGAERIQLRYAYILRRNDAVDRR